MYINFELLLKKELKPEELVLLTAIKLKETDYILSNANEEVLNSFSEKGYIKYVKAKNKSQNKLELVRIDTKGSKLLEDLSYAGAVDDESERIGDWVINTYKNKSGGIVKNKTEIKRRINWFKNITQIRGNFLALLIQSAMLDTYDPECGETFYDAKKNNSRLILSNMADNLFYSPESHFDKHYTLDKSPLYNYYIDNQEYIKQIWEKTLNENGSRK